MSGLREVAAGDLRMPVLAAAAWAGALVGGLGLKPVIGISVGGLVALAGLALRRGPDSASVALLGAGVVVVFVGTLNVTAARSHQVAHNPLADLARQRAAVEVVGTVVSDPRLLTSGRQDRLMWRMRAAVVAHHGRAVELSTPVLVMTDVDFDRPPLGARVRVDVRLAPATGGDLSAFANARAAPQVLESPSLWWAGAAAVRAAIRDSVAGRPVEQRALVPALVDGDDSQLPESLATQFAETGLTHLLAVSGTNLTLMVGFLVGVARWCRVRGRWLAVVGGLGIIGFILLARTEPSVLRAAVMGAVGLLGLSPAGRHRGLRVLAVAVVMLVLLDPGLATSAGFILSVLATAGILILAPGMRDAMSRWLPLWLAEAVAVPLAAQLACTPVVAAISGQVSLVAVAANVLAAPAVGPATVLGLAGGLVGLVSPLTGRLIGTLAAWCVGWIVTVAQHGAGLPTAAIGWGTGATALALLTLVVAAMGWLAPALLRRP
ncbi:ComEC/Rec2 family competence protein, partial [Nocardioides sp.]|uniref:ComEC/Rec2 family competence protein n=1 Tax=Nocardioides sp. TaxID=35761 RepID=UPI003563D0A6